MRTCLLTALLSFILLLNLCKRIPTLPEPEPGKRNYMWEVDTLDMPMNYLSSIWGASPNHVWAVGAGGTYKDRLQHYDGSRWSVYNKEMILCTGFTLYGFSGNNVWMGGGGGWLAHGAGIWHYDGVKWSQNYVYDVEGSYSMEVQDIWGIYPYDLYACGMIGFHDGASEDELRGFVLHYDGRTWKEVARAKFDSQFVVVRKEKSKIYLLSVIVKNYRIEGFEIYQLSENNLINIYSVNRTQVRAVNLYTIAGKTYFVMDHDIFRYVNGTFVKHLSVDIENFAAQICGRNENDLFLMMRDGIAHYNGVDFQYLYNFPLNSINFGYTVLFEKDIFICGLSRDSKNLIIHGRLKQ